MNKRHLKLIVSEKTEMAKKPDLKVIFDNAKENVKCLVTSKREKIFVLKDYLIKLYRDYEVTTGFCEIPFYTRAELKISEIIQEDKVDYYFKMFEKIKRKSLISKL